MSYLLRKTPLHPGKPLARRARMRQRSARRAREQSQWNRITQNKIDAGMTCELRIVGVCLSVPTQGHHWLPKGRGGKSTAWNHLLSCDACNLWIHANENDPRAKGLIKRSEVTT